MSLKKIAETLEDQKVQIEEISIELFDRIQTLVIDVDKIASRTMRSSMLLGSIEKSNRGILSAIKKLNKSDSNEKGDDLERRREEKSYNERLLKAISGVEQNTKGKGSTSGGKKGGLGIGAGAGGAGLGLAALRGAGVVTGLAALGFGIGSFFSGLALAGSISDMLGVNMNAVKGQMVTLGEAFSETPTDGLLKMGALLAAGGAFGALFGVGATAKAAVGMTAIGLGIGGFFAGLAASDGLSTLMSADGSMIKAQMINLAEGLGAFSDGQLNGLSVLLGAGALFGQVPAIAGKAAIGMAAIGAGIGGFFGALSLADKGMEMIGGDGSTVRAIMENTSAGLSSFNDVDSKKLLELSTAMPAFGLGFATLMAETGIGSVFDFVSRLFSSSDEKSLFEKTADGLKSFNDVDVERLNKMGNLSSIFDSLGSSLERLSDVDFKKIKRSMQDLGSVVSSNSSLFADENAIAVAYKINPTAGAMLKESSDINSELTQQMSMGNTVIAPVTNSSSSNNNTTNLVSQVVSSHDTQDPYLKLI